MSFSGKGSDFLGMIVQGGSFHWVGPTFSISLYAKACMFCLRRKNPRNILARDAQINNISGYLCIHCFANAISNFPGGLWVEPILEDEGTLKGCPRICGQPPLMSIEGRPAAAKNLFGKCMSPLI